MNLEKFEAMTQSMAARGARRGLVGGGLAALGLGVLHAPWPEEAAAEKKRTQRTQQASGDRRVRAGGPECTVCLDEDECPFTSVQAALTAAAAGDTITVCKGTYKETISIAKNVSLVADRGEDVVLDGAGRATVVTVERGVTAAIQGLRITDGRGRDRRTGGRGGGIVNFGNLTVTECVIEDNKGQNGGGISNESGGRLTLTNSLVHKNDGDARLPSPFPGPAFQGGGIVNNFNGRVTVVDSVIVENTATLGGGISNQGDMTITDTSRVSGNTADFGGGIFSLNQLTIQNGSTVAENEAKEDGGGIRITSGSATLLDARVTTNTARNGGGIAFSSPAPGALTVRRSFVVRNDARDNGGGILVSDNARVTVDAESKVAGNDPNDCVGTNACDA